MAILPPDPGALKCERQRSLAELSILVVAETECQRGITCQLLVLQSRIRFAATRGRFTSAFGLFPKISTTVENTVENIDGLTS
jgi:hypothetical protein